MTAEYDAAVGDRAQRRALREQLDDTGRLLSEWLEIGPQGAEQMCADCALPAFFHAAPRWSPETGQGQACPAWPGSRRHREELRRMWHELVEAKRAKPPAPPAPKPEPLAVLDATAPLSQVIARLTDVQAQHPEAQMRPGRGGRWEIWEPKRPREAAGRTATEPRAEA